MICRPKSRHLYSSEESQTFTSHHRSFIPPRPPSGSPAFWCSALPPRTTERGGCNGETTNDKTCTESSASRRVGFSLSSPHRSHASSRGDRKRTTQRVILVHSHQITKKRPLPGFPPSPSPSFSPLVVRMYKKANNAVEILPMNRNTRNTAAFTAAHNNSSSSSSPPRTKGSARIPASRSAFYTKLKKAEPTTTTMLLGNLNLMTLSSINTWVRVQALRWSATVSYCYCSTLLPASAHTFFFFSLFKGFALQPYSNRKKWRHSLGMVHLIHLPCRKIHGISSIPLYIYTKKYISAYLPSIFICMGGYFILPGTELSAGTLFYYCTWLRL